jgi:hypothetical protein
VLTPQERASLARIEQQLVLEDPAFAARLGHTGPPRARRPVILVALGLILLAVSLAVLLILGTALLLGQPVPVSTVVGLSLLCLACGAGYAVLRFVPGPDLP